MNSIGRIGLGMVLVVALFGFVSMSHLACSVNEKTNTDVSQEVTAVVGKIAEINMLQGSAVDYEGRRPKQYDNFTELAEKATSDELLALTHHQNGVVRCYSFWALARLDSVDIYPIVISHLSDTELVSSQFGCIIGKEMIGDFFVSIVKPELIDLEVRKLDSVQLELIDSILINGNYSLNARELAIERTSDR